MGQTAVDLLFARLEDPTRAPQRVLLPATLVTRSTLEAPAERSSNGGR